MSTTLPPTRCATCSADIAAGARRFRCSVAACNVGRHKIRFCSETCFRAHVPTARHRRADAVAMGPASGEATSVHESIENSL